jgi:predicted RNase H-like HicB family nuclease
MSLLQNTDGEYIISVTQPVDVDFQITIPNDVLAQGEEAIKTFVSNAINNVEVRGEYEGGNTYVCAEQFHNFNHDDYNAEAVKEFMDNLNNNS